MTWNLYCTGCLKTQAFRMEGQALICPRCAKTLDRVAGPGSCSRRAPTRAPRRGAGTPARMPRVEIAIGMREEEIGVA